MSDTNPTIPALPAGLAAVLNEQLSCWLNGQPITVEEILHRHPTWASNPTAVLELVYNEAILREQRGLSVNLPELQRRFPGVASQLEIQWQVDQAFRTRRDPSTPPFLPQPVAAAPAQVGRYRIERVLGAGGMGVVYQAWDPALERPLALKMLKGGSQSDEAVSRFRTEASAIAQLHHPHLVPVFDVGDWDGQPFIVMEYCAGGTLAERLRDGPMAPAAAAAALVQIGLGMAAAHENHILHRDLKPSNVLLLSGRDPSAPKPDGSTAVEGGSTNPGGTPGSKTSPVYKVTDFGLAKDLTSEEGLTQSGAILGTPNYMPPEQAFGQLKNLQPTADVYSLGAILYECLTGRPPFQGATVADTLNQVREQEPVSVRRLQPSAPCDLETICLKCLQKDPAKRYQTAAALVEDLSRFQSGKSILARPTSPVERGWRWARRNRLAATLSVAVVLISAIAAVGGTILSIWLAAALDRAQHDRDAARESDRQTREHLAASHAAAARLALQRGNGRVALRHLDEAAAAGLDTPAIQLDRVKALCATHELARAVEQVRLLAKRDDLGYIAGEVFLWQADLEIDAHIQDIDEGIKQIQLAMAKGLSDADQHYARGLLALTVPEAIDHFRRAVQADPTNPRTNAMLATLLTLSGRFPEARERVSAAQLLFPENPGFVLIHAMIDAFNEQPDAVRHHLATLRKHLGEQSYAMTAATVHFCQELTEYTRSLERLQCHDPSANRFVIGITFSGTLMKIQSIASKGARDLFLPFPPGLLQAFRTVARTLPKGFSAVLPPDQNSQTSLFERLGEFQPDGFFFMYAGVQKASGRTTEDWRAASKLFQRAAGCPSFLPSHRMSLYGSVVAESTLFNVAPAAEQADHRKLALDFISRLADMGLFGQQGYMIAKHCEELQAPEELSWRVIAAWERAAPNDARLPLCRAKVFLRSRAYEPAIRLADEALKQKDDPDWRKLRKQAEEEWGQRTKEHFDSYPTKVK